MLIKGNFRPLAFKPVLNKDEKSNHIIELYASYTPQIHKAKFYEMTLFDDRDFEIYIDEFTRTVKDSSKTIYENYIALDSGVESQFAKDCESSDQIEFYFKLPYWFEIKTPIGQYRPDWAVVFKGEKKIYFVAETKSAGQELRGSEKLKIDCGKAHFRNFDDVVYKRVSSVTELNN